MQVEFYRHALGEEEIASVTRTLRSTFLTAAGRTRQFEEAFADWLGLPRAVGLYSCTSALVLGLRALGVQPGDEVITTPMTFIATANAIIEAGGVPVFADVEPATGLLDPAAVAAAVTPRTVGILPVHLYGQMCDMVALGELARRHGLFVLEDAAHCVEGQRDGVGPGQVGDGACFSFYATKNLCSGEGGALATRHPWLAERLLRLRSHGMDKAAGDRHSGQYRHWDMVELGYKANMFDIQAALLLPQLPRLLERLAAREAICRHYEAALTGVPGLALPVTVPGGRHARHLFTLWAPRPLRDPLLAELNRQGVGCAVNYRAITGLTYYRERFGFIHGRFPVAEEIGDRTLSLPLWVGLPREQQEHVIRVVRNFLEAHPG